MSRPVTTTRRGLFRALFGRPLRKPPLVSWTGPARESHARPGAVVFPHRPPGAATESVFRRLCTGCDACTEACPEAAITWTPATPGGPRMPVIDAREAPCRLCTDLPCAAACETGALSLERGRVMGNARVSTAPCLPFCSVCVEHCPVPGAMLQQAGKLSVDADLCAGCGVCLHVCPSPQPPLQLEFVPRPPVEAR